MAILQGPGGGCSDQFMNVPAPGIRNGKGTWRGEVFLCWSDVARLCVAADDLRASAGASRGLIP
jgi:hypothetical protein